MKQAEIMETPHFESFFPSDARHEEIEKMLSYIRSGNSVQLISLPGVGRSNIMGLLSYQRAARQLHLGEDAEKKFHFVMMNFSEIKGRPLIDATKYLFLELSDSLNERKMEEEYKYTQSIFHESLKANDELVLFQGLKKTIDYLCLEREMTVVFLFDRFEDYLLKLEPDFFSHLRVLRDRAKYHFSVVFPVNRPLEELVGPEILSDFYEFIVGNIVYVSLMDEKLLDFRLDYIQKQAGKTLDKKLIDEIITLTGGVGKLTRICAEAVLSENEAPKNLQEFLSTNSRANAVLEEIWKSFTPYEKSLIQNENASESAHLVAVGLVKNKKIAIPLLENFLKNSRPNEESDLKIIFDQNTKEIKKGDNIISEGLTSSEFKLLRFLVENEGKILERDEIINAVWGELSSTAGVSEQALDQLIFRVRKKIEENPTSPIHLQTIKGRGFKFIS